jgi:hypothetical protein
MVHRTTKQVQLHRYHQPRRAGATQPEEDKLMSMSEWIVELDEDLQIIQVVQRVGADPDPRNGPLGVMFTDDLDGCVYDEWTAGIDPDVGWAPQSPKRTWAWVREQFPHDTLSFYTNAVDELGAFANLRAWLRARTQVPTCGQNPLTQ